MPGGARPHSFYPQPRDLLPVRKERQKINAPPKMSLEALCFMDFHALGRQNRRNDHGRTIADGAERHVEAAAPGRKRASREKAASRAQGTS